ALVALLAGSAVLMTQLARQHVSSRYRHVLAVGLAALAVAIALGIAVSPRSTIERFVEFVGNPILAAGSRLLTWDAALRLATDCAPWGCGAGLFWLLFRGYQMPTDASAGFHAHLDPLEILVELGWPGLALLVALTAAVVMRTREAWRACANDPASQARLAGCGAALAAFMTHSLVTFNLYVAALVALAGLIMGGIGLAPPERRVAHPMARGSRFTAVALAAGIGAYLSATAYGAHFYHQAVSAPDAPSINELRERLEHARRFAPGADVVLVARADLELRVLESLFRVPGTPAAELSSQFDLASYFVDRTVRVNPLRPDGHEFRGRLELMDWRRPGPERVAAAIEAYAAALERSPGRPDVREQLGQMMQSLGRHGAAAGLFADGVAWAKTSSDELRFGIQALRAYVEAGDHDAARALRETVVAAAERERRRGNDLGDVAGMADALLDGMAP
ncbi:MAG: O-antigen ligase family protein, partial [Gammaproteobacteria bacterium]|nr:O-antigen ligase family protein [Gammaproteobacteria bacterium]